jgi:predicted Zn finger-like uncharacterized protein
MAIVINCPSCGRKLRVPDELLGKKVRCPGCQTMFAGRPEPSAPVPAAATASAQGESPPPEAPSPAEPPPSAPTLNLSLDAEPAPRPRPPATPESVAPEPLVPPPPPPQQEDDFRSCPYCGEQIRREAIRCRFCGEDIDEPAGGDEDDRPWERPYGPRVRRDCEPHRGNMILVFGIISLATLAFCGVIGLPFGIMAWVMGHKDMLKIDQGVMDPEGRGSTQAGKICGIIGTIIDGLYLLGCLAYFGFIGIMIALGNMK